MTRDKYGIPNYANSTLLSMPKSELLGYIRTIEKNWRNAEQTIEIQVENCKKLLAEERNKAIDDFIDNVVEELNKRIVIEPLDCADAEWNNALYKAIEIVKGSVKNE